MDETLRTALMATAALDLIGVRWFLGGSLASSLLGTPRATLDADIVADLRPPDVMPFLDRLGEDWYADEGAIREALANRSSFNLIHMKSALKVDVFVPKRRPFDVGQFSRVTLTPVGVGSPIEIPVCSAEDIIVAKLEWYRLGAEISERQWGDILGVIRANQASLDRQVLADGAKELGVSDLLARAMSEAGRA